MKTERERIKLTEEQIFDVMTSVLLSGKLAPGLKLGEQQLADIFGVTRERIRKVLHRLGNQRLIEVHPNRGAFVAEPGLGEAHKVYQARRILESGVVSYLSAAIGPSQLRQLTHHLELERQANGLDNHQEAVRLSGLFHKHLADMTGNDFIIRQMQELVNRTVMLVAYHEADHLHCGCEEHESILNAIQAGDAAIAATKMQTHLTLIESRLQERPIRPATTDLEAVIADALTDGLQPENAIA
jgi:DNA-binding GntR family transcriptional regulator